MKYALIAFAIINIFGFIIVAVDKYKAKRKLWRIPEKLFFIISLLGGCPGVYTGLLVIRHKTRHWYFMYGIPAIFLVQSVILYLLLKNHII
jgi:Predicted membrane protein